MPAFPAKIVTVGTSTVVLLSANDRRQQYTVVFPSTAKIAGNTGSVYISAGTPPVATAGSTSAGHQMQAGDTFSETTNVPTDRVSTDIIYAIASTSGQIVEVYEISRAQL